MAWVMARATTALLASLRVLPAPAGQRATCAHEALTSIGSSTTDCR